MPFSIAAPAAVLPTAVYVWLIWRLDRYEKEPWGIAMAAFVWGAIPAVLGALIAETVFGIPINAFLSNQSELINSSVVAPVVEECVKALALLAIFVIKRAEFDDVLDGIIYGSLVGLGFSMTENLLYFLAADSGGWGAWAPLVIGRGMVFGFNHAMFTALTGIGLGLARYAHSTSRRALLLLLGLGMAIAAHLMHNLLLSLEDLCFFSVVVDWIGVLAVSIILFLTWRREHAWIIEELAPEVEAGVLTAADLAAVVSPARRLRREWRLRGMEDRRLGGTWRRFSATAAELAFKKHQQAVLGAEKGGPNTIAALRLRLTGLRAELSAMEDGVPLPAADEDAH